jgi:hypothetical protein
MSEAKDENTDPEYKLAHAAHAAPQRRADLGGACEGNQAAARECELLGDAGPRAKMRRMGDQVRDVKQNGPE